MDSPESAVRDTELAATAAICGSTKVLRCLRAHGADLTCIDRFGWSPLALAKRFKRTEAEDFLRRQTAWVSALPTRWIGGRDGTTLSGDGLVVSNTEHSKFCLSTERPLPPGLERYYFEMTLKAMTPSQPNEHPIVAIGFCTHDASQFRFPGFRPLNLAHSAKSWAYHGDDGLKWCDGDIEFGTSDDWQHRYGVGDTVGAGFDSQEGIVWFTRNGKIVAPILRGVEGRMFPLIGVDDEIVIGTNFGPDGLQWKDTLSGKGACLEPVVEEEDGSHSADEEVSEADKTDG